MFEFLALTVLAVAGVLVFGVLFSLGSLVLWLILLPFKLLALVFRGLAFLFVLPFMLLIGIIGLVIFGFGFAVFFLPVLPLIGVVALVWWLVKRSSPAPTTS